MKSIAVQRARDLQSPARQWVQSLLGRELQEEEEVAVLALPSSGVPTEAIRQAAAAHLSQIMDRAAEKAVAIPDQERDDLLEEALTQVSKVRGALPYWR